MVYVRGLMRCRRFRLNYLRGPYVDRFHAGWERSQLRIEIVVNIASQASVNDKIEPCVFKQPSWSRIVDAYQRDTRFSGSPSCCAVEWSFGHVGLEPQTSLVWRLRCGIS